MSKNSLFFFLLFLISFQQYGNAQVFSNENQTSYAGYYCQVWGLVKYFHPQAAEGKVDMDKLFLKSYADLMKVDSRPEFNTLLNGFLKNFDFKNTTLKAGEIHAILQNKMYEVKKLKFLKDSSLYWVNLDFSWLENKIINEDIRLKLLQLLIQYKAQKHINIIYDKNGFHQFKENTYDSLKQLKAEHYLLAYFQYWNLVNYFYPYLKMLDKSWSKVLFMHIGDFIQISNRQKYVTRIKKLAALTNDSHSFVYDLLTSENQRNKSFPFELKIVEDKMVVSKILDTVFTKSNQIRIGDFIQQIDHKSLKALKDSILPMIPHSIEKNWAFALGNYLNRFYADSALFSFENNKKWMIVKKEKNTATYSTSPTWKIIDPNIAYLNVFALTNREEWKIYEQLKQCTKFILDLRGYPTINKEGLVEYFTDYTYRIADKPHKVAKIYLPYSKKGLFPGVFQYTATSSYAYEPKKFKYPKYLGKIIALIDESTISQTETECMIVKSYSRDVKFIGTNTAGANGMVISFNLLGQIQPRFALIPLTFADGTHIQRKGITPDIEVKPTIQGIKEGRDEVLERAIEYIKTGK